MTLADITLPVSYESVQGRWLVFEAALAQRLLEVHEQYGNPHHIPNPIPLSDGRFALNADILTECVPGGIMYGGFSHLDSSRFSEIEVVLASEIASLVPPDPVIG